MEKYAAIIGLHKLESDEQNKFNYRNVGVFIFFLLSFASSTAFVLFDANTPREYTNTIFPWFSLLFACIGFIFNILQVIDFLNLKAKAENLIEVYSIKDPVFKYLFEERNKTIDKWTKIIHGLYFKGFFPIFFILIYIAIFCLYYSQTDKGIDAYIMYAFMK